MILIVAESNWSTVEKLLLAESILHFGEKWDTISKTLTQKLPLCYIPTKLQNYQFSYTKSNCLSEYEKFGITEENSIANVIDNLKKDRILELQGFITNFNTNITDLEKEIQQIKDGEKDKVLLEEYNKNIVQKTPRIKSKQKSKNETVINNNTIAEDEKQDNIEIVESTVKEELEKTTQNSDKMDIIPEPPKDKKSNTKASRRSRIATSVHNEEKEEKSYIHISNVLTKEKEAENLEKSKHSKRTKKTKASTSPIKIKIPIQVFAKQNLSLSGDKIIKTDLSSSESKDNKNSDEGHKKERLSKSADSSQSEDNHYSTRLEISSYTPQTSSLHTIDQLINESYRKEKEAKEKLKRNKELKLAEAKLSEASTITPKETEKPQKSKRKEERSRPTVAKTSNVIETPEKTANDNIEIKITENAMEVETVTTPHIQKIEKQISEPISYIVEKGDQNMDIEPIKDQNNSAKGEEDRDQSEKQPEPQKTDLKEINTSSNNIKTIISLSDEEESPHIVKVEKGKKKKETLKDKEKDKEKEKEKEREKEKEKEKEEKRKEKERKEKERKEKLLQEKKEKERKEKEKKEQKEKEKKEKEQKRKEEKEKRELEKKSKKKVVEVKKEKVEVKVEPKPEVKLEKLVDESPKRSLKNSMDLSMSSDSISDKLDYDESPRRVIRDISLLQETPEELTQKHQKFMTTLLEVWKTLANNKYARVFRDPVTEEEAPGYFDIIKQPIDLSTIRKKLSANEYEIVYEYYRDLQLMISNALFYNAKDSAVYDMALHLKKIVNKELGAILDVEDQLIALGLLSLKKKIIPKVNGKHTDNSRQRKNNSGTKKRKLDEIDNEEESPNIRRSKRRKLSQSPSPKKTTKKTTKKEPPATKEKSPKTPKKPTTPKTPKKTTPKKTNNSKK